MDSNLRKSNVHESVLTENSLSQSSKSFEFELLDNNGEEWMTRYFTIKHDGDLDEDAVNMDDPSGGTIGQQVIECSSREGLVFVVDSIEQNLSITRDLLVRRREDHPMFQVGNWYLRVPGSGDPYTYNIDDPNTNGFLERDQFIDLVQGYVNRHIIRENLEM